MLTEVEKARLEELINKRKSKRLDDKEFKEFKKLQAKAGGHGANSRHDTGAGKPGNDFAWWNKESELVRDSANILPDTLPGQPLDPVSAPVRLVGVVRYLLAPTLGGAWETTDGVNMEFRSLYLKMFQKYRTAAYQYPDLAFAILGGVEIAKMVAKLERIYGIINRYSKVNFNVPDVELRALGIDDTVAAYIRNHMSDFRYDLNQLIKKAQQVYIPKQMSVVADAISLFGYEYADHDSDKAQRIIIDTEMFGVIDEKSLATGTSLYFYHVNDRDYPLIQITDSESNMFPLLQFMIERLVGSDSMQKIFGDLATWFGEEQSLVLLPIPEEWVIQPVYSEEILHKLHNVHLVPGSSYINNVIAPDMTSADVTKLQADLDVEHYRFYQFNNCLKARLCLSEDSEDDSYSTIKVAGEANVGVVMSTYHQSGALDHGITILDTYRKDMTPETVLEGVMYKPGYINGYSSDGTLKWTVMFSATFYVCTEIMLFNRTASGTEVNTQSLRNGDQFNENGTNAAATAGQLSVIDWAPLTFRTNAVEDTFCIVENVFGDYDNIKVLSLSNLVRIQTAIVISGVKTELVVRTKAN